jgi:predicted PurR-regulated permease PerM
MENFKIFILVMIIATFIFSGVAIYTANQAKTLAETNTNRLDNFQDTIDDLQTYEEQLENYGKVIGPAIKKCILTSAGDASTFLTCLESATSSN